MTLFASKLRMNENEKGAINVEYLNQCLKIDNRFQIDDENDYL